MCFSTSSIVAHGFLCIPFCVLGLDSYCLQVSAYFQSPKISIIVNVTFRFFLLSIGLFYFGQNFTTQ
jgi:hypothetical protein